MITLIEALNYQCLRYVRQPLGPFHVLVGPNASGKTTFLDVVSFLGDLVSDGPEAAVRKRTDDFRDLVWMRQNGSFELAIEAVVSGTEVPAVGANQTATLRYEVALHEDPQTHGIALSSETLRLGPRSENPYPQKDLFPEPLPTPKSLSTKMKSGIKTIINKSSNGMDYFYPEGKENKRSGSWIIPFRIGSGKSALGYLPEDEEKFPTSVWLKKLLSEGVQPFVLNSQLIRLASAPGQGTRFKTDGSNLPWIVALLEHEHPQRLRAWMQHVRTALPDLELVSTKEREDDRHRYLWLKYANGLEIPSWMASDGTVRLLALTLPAYLPGFRGVYLIEEPENGIHPTAVEAVVQSLSSVYNAQILVASHAPVILGSVEPESVLCFAKTAEGATDIVAGDKHPRLRDWRREENLGVLFSAGVLG